MKTITLSEIRECISPRDIPDAQMRDVLKKHGIKITKAKKRRK